MQLLRPLLRVAVDSRGSTPPVVAAHSTWEQKSCCPLWNPVPVHPLICGSLLPDGKAWVLCQSSRPTVSQKAGVLV